jgi:hypothetical protein
MGAGISIPKVLKGMDGFFGCKVVRTTNENGQEAISFRKKNFFDWVLDIVCNLENHPLTREKTVAALGKLAKEIKEAESGQFESLVKKYASSDAKIDFSEVRKVLEESLSWEFPPSVFSRENVKGDLGLLSAYKDVHTKNLKKCICMEGDAIPLTPDPNLASVSDANIKGFCEALDSFAESYELPDAYSEPISHYGNRQTEIRVQLALYELLKEKGDAPSQEEEIYIKDLKSELKKFPQYIDDFAEYDETEYEDRYRPAVQNFLDGNAVEVEIFLGPDGIISNENIAGLAKAIFRIDIAEKEKISAPIDKSGEVPASVFQLLDDKFFIPEKTVEKKSDILVRISAAWIDARNRHWNVG